MSLFGTQRAVGSFAAVEVVQPGGPVKLVCVTGMHRSGTSLVARMVSLLGFHLGSPDSLIEEAPDNPAGFFENRDVVLINDELLHRRGGTWDAPPILPHGWELASELDDLRAHAGRVLRRSFGWSRRRMFKDPRCSLTLPFWRTVTTPSRVVIAIREPDAVAQSLHSRNGMATGDGVLLWLRYVLSAAMAAPDAFYVRYNDVLADVNHTLDRLATYIDAPAPSAEAREAALSHVDRRLDHGAGVASLEGSASALARDLYERLPDSAAYISSLASVPWSQLLASTGHMQPPVVDAAADLLLGGPHMGLTPRSRVSKGQ